VENSFGRLIRQAPASRLPRLALGWSGAQDLLPLKKLRSAARHEALLTAMPASRCV